MSVTLSDSWAAPHLKDNCVDGNPDTFCHSKHAHGWWVAFTLDEPTCINSVTVLNRHSCCQDRIVGSGISIVNQGTEIWTDTFDKNVMKYTWNLAGGPQSPVDVSNALVVSPLQQMFDAGWEWTGCAHNDHGGSHLVGGIWCHSQKQMHLKVPMSGGPSSCTATWSNAYSNTGADGFVRLMKNGVQLDEARANEQKTVTFDYKDGDAIEFWEGFAIIKVTADWLSCGDLVGPPMVGR